MLYFKTIPYPENVTQPQLEKALRKYALKRTSVLDFKSCTFNIGLEQLFLGHERKNDLQFTRIKTSFEMLLTKLIIKLSKDPAAKGYRIRLSAVPLALALVLGFGVIANIMAIFTGNVSIESLVTIGLPLIIFIGLIYFELTLVIGRVKNALDLSGVTTFPSS